jgi:hypothetical protein
MHKVVAAGFAAIALSACNTPVKGPEPEMSAEAAERLADFVRTGDRVKCVSLRSVSEIEPLTDDLFLIRVGVSDYYLNRMKGRCSGAASAFNRIEYRTSLSQLCQNEIANVVDNSTGMRQGGCAFGDFERLERKDEPAVQ